MKLFKSHDIEEHADIAADYLPNDVLFGGKKIDGANTRKFLKGCAHFFKKSEDALNQVSDEYDISKTTDFIEEWESWVGIPDECFDKSGTLDQRRKNVLFKMASANVQTEQDFIDMAAGFGVVITIDNTVPFETEFIGTGVTQFVPAYDVPFTPDIADTSFECWTKKLIDALNKPIFTNL